MPPPLKRLAAVGFALALAGAEMSPDQLNDAAANVLSIAK